MKNRSRGADNTTHPYATARVALEHAVRKNLVVRIFYGDEATGLDDCDETRLTGRVNQLRAGVFALTRITFGKHTFRPIALNNVVRVRSGRHDLYRHKKYSVGMWSWRYNESLGRWTAARNGLIHATFSDETGAASYCAYIAGDIQRLLGFPYPETTYCEIVKRSIKIEDTYYYKMIRNNQLASFGMAIRLCRAQKNISQGDLAKASRLSTSYISYLERDERDPVLSTITKIAAALDVPVPTLVFLAYNKDQLRELDFALAEKLSRFALNTTMENG